MTRNEAFLTLSLLILLILYGFASLNQAFPPRESKPTDGEDARMYLSIIERVHTGENYYQVVGDELRTRGYATRPFFNWRLPSLAWVIGQLPHPEWGRWVLIFLGSLTLFWWVQALDRGEGFPFALAGCALLCGPLLLCLSEKGFLYHELWAGLLIAFSLAAHARGSWVLSAITGILAMFVRELALPYGVIMFVLAWKEKGHREGFVWLGGLLAFGFALGFHGYTVTQLTTPVDQVNESWIQLSGWPFVLRTGTWNAFLLVAPKWVVAMVLPLALLGLAGWRGRVGSRVALTLSAYCCAFLFAGRMDNSYWGIMYAPLVPLGVLYALPSLLDLGRTAFGQRKILDCLTPSR